MVRFGLIGYGAWGRFHAEAIEACANAELRAVATVDPSDRDEAARAYPRALVTDDYRRLIERDDVDAVSIVAPNSLHEPIAIDAFAHGKHVLVEKPLALDVDGCDRIIAAAARAGRVLNVVHQLRLSTQWGRVKAWIDEGRIGAPLAVHLSLWRRPFRSGADGWRFDPARVGSWLLEELVHFVDLGAWYLEAAGEPTRVSALGALRNRSDGLTDNLTLQVQWPRDAYASFGFSVAGFEDHKVLEVVGDKGSVRATWSAAMDRGHPPHAALQLLEGLDGNERFETGEPRQVSLGDGSGEVLELGALVDRVVDGLARGRAVVDGVAGRRAVALCDAALRSASGHETVVLRDVA